MNPSEKNKKILFCADDFGLTKSISESIVALAKLKKVDATSVMVGIDDLQDVEFNKGINELIKYDVQIGLHFYLTTKPILINNKKVIIKNQLDLYFKIRKYGTDFIVKEFYRQLNDLEKIKKTKLDFIDSHHYLLSYPIVSKIIFEEINKNPILKTYVYKVATNTNTSIKAKLLNLISKKTIENNKGLCFISGILGIHGFNISYEELKDLMINDCSKATSGLWHFSTHPCENPMDIVGVDELVEFRKVDYLLLKERL